MVEAILCSAARFAISTFCPSMNLVYNSLFGFSFGLGCCSFCMHFTSVFAAEIADNGRSGSFMICADYAKIVEERHGA